MMVERSVLNQIRDLLDCHSSDFQLLGGYFENVYEISSEVPIVVKIFNREIDNEEQVLSEIEWTQFLNGHGLNVILPILINEESYINNLTENMFFVAYKKAVGNHIDINNSKVWNKKLFNQWGRGMGTMHSLAKKYKGKYKRPEWYEHKIYRTSIEHIDEEIKKKWMNNLAELKSMNKSKNSYGIIHGDLHQHNFLYDKGDLTFIDFGDSESNWFAYDIAIAIYHASQSIKETDQRNKFASLFFKSFIEGYAMENSVSELLNQIVFFINFRHLYSYVYHNLFLDKAKLNEQQLQYLEDMRVTLINQDSYLRISIVT